MIGGTADHRSAARLERFGAGHGVVVVENMLGDVEAVRSLAAERSPFPAATSHYPGVRLLLDERDHAGWAYARRIAERAAPFIAGAFDCEGFDLVEASFSIVTTPPDRLTPPQRAPHFDSVDPDLIAMLHFLAPAEGSGTAFFRHRLTGIEQIDAGNLDRFVHAARAEGAARAGYVQGPDAHFDEIARFDAIPDRLLIYPGNLLHSGIIPAAMTLDPDPLRGRLTGNFFLKVRR